ncbi:unnamed protein product [Staurois parvus]|uniref:Uncharacterized protein n=1 Tax=Staurois parvus TaxID=386267 RepID=A0ABN9DFT4_9NEOB|nr:unnamed protein product [Staurois parvus]
MFFIFRKILTKKIQLQKTCHSSYEVQRTVYFAIRGRLGDICTVLTFLDLKKLDWLSVLQD